MPTTTLDAAQLHNLARLGAIARLKDLDVETAAIKKMFPGLKEGQGAAPKSPVLAPKAKPRKRKRWNMSAEARQAAAERMKAYWAKKRGEQASTGR
jgi:hypothetical protein